MGYQSKKSCMCGYIGEEKERINPRSVYMVFSLAMSSQWSYLAPRCWYQEASPPTADMEALKEN